MLTVLGDQRQCPAVNCIGRKYIIITLAILGSVHRDIYAVRILLI